MKVVVKQNAKALRWCKGALALGTLSWLVACGARTGVDEPSPPPSPSPEQGDDAVAPADDVDEAAGPPDFALHLYREQEKIAAGKIDAHTNEFGGGFGGGEPLSQPAPSAQDIAPTMLKDENPDPTIFEAHLFAVPADLD